MTTKEELENLRYKLNRAIEVNDCLELEAFLEMSKLLDEYIIDYTKSQNLGETLSYR